jgi:hypothetical protein
MAIAFFDLVCGQEPNWEAPDVPWLRRIVERERKLAREESSDKAPLQQGQ